LGTGPRLVGDRFGQFVHFRADDAVRGCGVVPGHSVGLMWAGLLDVSKLPKPNPGGRREAVPPAVVPMNNPVVPAVIGPDPDPDPGTASGPAPGWWGTGLGSLCTSGSVAWFGAVALCLVTALG
jgi:hypothetical protein